MSARGEVITEIRLRPAVIEAVEAAAATLDYTGLRALRVLLHAGVSAYWPLVKATPEKQIRSYEMTLQALRARWAVKTDCFPDPIATDFYREKDAEVTAFLEMCAELSGTQWLEPVEAIACNVVSIVQGTVLRWLADCNDETMLVVLDEMVSALATKATER
ncbi:TetR family transcriptional regulator [Nocardia implantans]|uniref:TetR family transcriptional regulator n=1 Tax=Nocardia implantans TaxID=3108168 RepID=A0ABU6B277_9NOCA|nr:MULTISPECIES: TetR family transcriptional regulator [unclassified Nocardia]MBF6194984.1 TetR family transcriptional regulator [Nocardia beijingensis]MEA3530355.1 TetR family transcriptional regulator [Nocardia sp. CDC192]MEB3513785.1 TetR family transcriptional regulator [Nocardia sp. CDC186]